MFSCLRRAFSFWSFIITSMAFRNTPALFILKKSGNNIKITHTLSKVPVFFLSANCDASTKNGKTFIFIVLDNNKKQRLFQNDSLTFASGPHTRSFNSTILSLILVRYRFSIKLWADRFSVLTPPWPLPFVRRLIGILFGSKTMGIVAVRTPLGPWDSVGWICDWLSSIVPMTVEAESGFTICGCTRFWKIQSYKQFKHTALFLH